MGEWLRLRDGCPDWTSESVNSEVLVCSPGRALLGEELLGTVASARRSVIAINPLLTDSRMLSALIGARQRGVRIKIITELRDNRGKGVKYPTRGFEAENPINVQKHFENIRALVQEGILCRGLQHYAHGKALIVDDLHLVLSSVNWTENSLGWGEQPSLEAGISIRERAVVTAWSKALANLWNCCPFRLHSLDGDISLQQLPSMAASATGLERRCRENVRMSWSYHRWFFAAWQHPERLIREEDALRYYCKLPIHRQKECETLRFLPEVLGIDDLSIPDVLADEELRAALERKSPGARDYFIGWLLQQVSQDLYSFGNHPELRLCTAITLWCRFAETGTWDDAVRAAYDERLCVFSRFSDPGCLIQRTR